MIKKSTKKIYLFIPLIILVILLLVNTCKVATFSFDEMFEYTGMEGRLVNEYYVYGTSEKNSVTNKNTAIKEAKKIWDEMFDATEQYWHTDVYYDKEYGYWYIIGMSVEIYCSQFNPFYGVCGGVYHAIISSDGQLVAVWVEV